MELSKVEICVLCKYMNLQIFNDSDHALTKIQEWRLLGWTQVDFSHGSFLGQEVSLG